ncbi:GNAT family N-acetyltransferase [Aestuariibacter salexigens]|uniref:GNAT family N-acetyltransferase n=1 Tax=Aestuariibacter salexigens TaxID=226010 RepID=UPI0004046DE0|nr:GNAT family N-acetyltransferase [Aestuariibacter salexigens]
MQIDYQPLGECHYEGLLTLANFVHGDNYLDHDGLTALHKASVKDGVNVSWVALQGDDVVGFRLTQAAGNWSVDKWCTPSAWGVPIEDVAYFKCNTVSPALQGHGIGSTLLSLSIDKLKQQGSQAGLAHIWLASPGNSAFRYFTRCGGRLVREHPNKWQEHSIHDGYLCPVCGELCHCTAAEMIITF